MSVREYIGARYVPLFMGDWDNSNTYEPLSIVMYEGDSYTSRQFVPEGVAITNTAYWAVTGNYNAQIEAYREEVLEFDDRITQNANDIDDLETAVDGKASTTALEDEISARELAISSLEATINNSILTYDWSTLEEVNAEINTTGASSIFVMYNQMTRELNINGAIRATDQTNGFTRAAGTKLFKLPSTIPLPTSQVYVYGMFECLDGAVGSVNPDKYISIGYITTDGEVYVNNLAGFTSPTTVKNIVVKENTLQYSSRTSTSV